MNEATRPRPNPLARVALAAPPALGRALALGGRIAGAAFALAIASDQSFTRTRALALALAALALIALLPLPGRWAARLPWIGAGVLFFGGALLAHLALGVLMAAAGAFAAVGLALDERRTGRPAGVPAFFTGLGVTIGLVVVIILGIEG